MRTGFDPLGQLPTLGCGAFARPSWRGLVDETGHALAQVWIAVIANSLLPKRQHISHVADTVTVRQTQEGMEALDQCQRTTGVGLLETALEVLAGERAEL